MANVMDRIQDLLVDVDYPANKDTLLREAERHGADEDALRALRGLPPVDYRSQAEVLSSVDVGPGELSDQSPGTLQQPRQDSQRGLAEHMKDVDAPPVEQETGSNDGS